MAGEQEKPLALLVNPPVYDFALYDLFIKPLGLLRLGAWLESGGYEVRLLDYLDYRDPHTRSVLGLPKRWEDGTGKFFRQRIAKPLQLAAVPRHYARYGILAEAAESQLAAIPRRPALVLMSTGMTYWYPGAVEAARAVRARFPSAPLIVGGIYATLCPEHCLRTVAPDRVVCGQAWPRLRLLLRELNLPAPSSPPDGHSLLMTESLADAAVLQLNRGCPFRCAYCASHLVSGGFEPGQADDIFQLIHRIHARYGTRNFAFYDDALLAAADSSLYPLLRFLSRSRMKLRFYLPNAVHLAHIDATGAELMRRAGFQEMRLGLESTSTEFHESMDTKLQVEMLGDAVEALRTGGFAPSRITAYLLAGLPGQTGEQVERSIRDVTSFGIRVSLAEYSPVPGTGLWKESLRLSRFPLRDEPLVQNNSVQPLEWRHLTRAGMQSLKDLARELSPPAVMRRRSS